MSGSFDRTVKLWDIGGTDDRRVSAPVKRAVLENVAGPTGLLKGAPVRLGDESSPQADSEGAADALLSDSVPRPGRGKAAVTQGRRVFGLKLAMKLEEEKGTQAPAGSHADRVQVCQVSVLFVSPVHRNAFIASTGNCNES